MLRQTDDAIDWERLDSYARGVGDPEQRAALESWVSADSLRRALADTMRTIGRPRSKPTGRRPDVFRAWSRVQSELGLEIAIGESSNPLVAAYGSAYRLDKRP